MTLSLVFAGSTHYPNGGWEDFQGALGSIDSARAHVEANAAKEGWDWAQVVECSADRALALGTAARWSSGEYGWRSGGGLDAEHFKGWQDAKPTNPR